MLKACIFDQIALLVLSRSMSPMTPFFHHIIANIKDCIKMNVASLGIKTITSYFIKLLLCNTELQVCNNNKQNVKKLKVKRGSVVIIHLKKELML